MEFRHSVSVYISVQLQRQIRAHFANCCAYCRTTESLTVTSFEFEHIVPLSKGGETVFGNLCLACPSCNRYKAVRQTATDPIAQTEVPMHQKLKNLRPLEEVADFYALNF